MGVLQLEKNNLWGQIPSEIGLATTLNFVAIGYYNLTGSIPTEFGLLTAFSMFGMEENRINGTLPTEFPQLKTLEYFRFEKNSLTGSVNDALCGSNGWTFLQGDCLIDTAGRVEVECSCCSACCADASALCVPNNSQ